MSGPFKWFGNGVLKVVNGSIDLDNDTFKLMLTTSSYTPNQDTHDFRDDVTNEVAASGSYSAGGATLSGVSVTYDSASNEVRISWTSPITFTNFTGTARTAVIYKSRGGASNADELLAYATEASDVTATSNDFVVTLASPTLKLTVS